MTRYFTLVLLPPTDSEDQASSQLSRLLYPYFESADVDSYLYPCECTQTEDIGFEAAEEQIGQFRTLWVAYHNMDPTQRPSWRDYIAPWEQAAERAARASESYSLPDPDCDDCNGTGRMEMTSVYGGKYDYWRLFINDTDYEQDVVFGSANVWPVAQLQQPIRAIECGAIITPDGYWHESPRGWWDYNDEAWQQQAANLLQAHPHAIAVRCLLHI